MKKSKSEDDLRKSVERNFYESKTATTGFVEQANSTNGNSRTSLASSNDMTPPSTPNIRSSVSPENLAANQKPSKNDVLKLNEETNTWNTPKRVRKNSYNRNRNHLQSSIAKLHSYLIHENAPEFRFRVIVAFLFFIIVATVLLTRYFHYHLEINKSIIDQIYMHKNTRKITFIDRDGNNLLHIKYGLNIPGDIQPVNCRSLNRDNILCLDWKYRAHLSVKFLKNPFINSFKQKDPITCYKFRWQSYEKYITLKDCFDMTDSFWFGMGDLNNLTWPLNKLSTKAEPFITSHQTTDPLSGSIIARTWLLSKGASITVPLDVPLFVSINSTENPNEVCFISQKRSPYYINNLKNYLVHLEYSVCLAQNLSTLQNHIFKTNLQGDLSHLENIKPVSEKQTANRTITDLTKEHEGENIFLDRIIWATNMNVLPNFTQQAVQSYVDQITNYGFGLAGIVLLDPRWENTIGELKMNEAVFNNPKVLVNILHNKGFKIILTLSPNLALRSPLVDVASDYIYLDSKLRAPLLTRCSADRESVCALINFTNPINCDRFKMNIENELLSPQVGLSVDGLYLQGIQSSLIPRHINFDRSINPDQFLENINSVVKKLPTSLGLSTSVNSNEFFGYITISPRDSTWKALKSIIPSVLSLGLLGYPLVNTDTVGGRHIFTKLKNETDYTNKKLYLRWLQLTIFLPVVQFAEPPGGNDLDVIKIAKRLLNLRREHFLPAMKASLREYYQNGSPIIRPMWWTQNDPDAYQIDDQFFVGNNIMVAPIVEEGKTERDIFLPHGWWKDEILAQVIRGGKWMRKYQVPLDKVAFFVRTEPSAPAN